jgi:hypothetical protein
VVNALVVAQSYSPLARQSHNIGAVLFMGLGLVMSLAGLVGFARRRHWTGAAAALLLLLLQASLAACLAASSF